MPRKRRVLFFVYGWRLVRLGGAARRRVPVGTRAVARRGCSAAGAGRAVSVWSSVCGLFAADGAGRVVSVWSSVCGLFAADGGARVGAVGRRVSVVRVGCRHSRRYAVWSESACGIRAVPPGASGLGCRPRFRRPHPHTEYTANSGILPVLCTIIVP